VHESEKRGTLAETIDNPLFVLILQHPQERKQALATAGLTCAMLKRAALVNGLSWPNLSGALGRLADARRWAVLYLGSARPAALATQRVVIAVDHRGNPVSDQDAAVRDLDGIVVLDGSWSEAKTLWWRNPWLLKLRRLVLNPQHPSRFGRMRREPRREALSTLEAVAAILNQLDGSSGAETVLLDSLDHLIAEVRSTHRDRQRRVSR
jgi:DTW domain-containing protein YfiP